MDRLHFSGHSSAILFCSNAPVQILLRRRGLGFVNNFDGCHFVLMIDPILVFQGCLFNLLYMLLLLLLSAFWPKYLSGRKALWYFFHGKNSQVHYIRHVCQVRLSRKVNKIIEF